MKKVDNSVKNVNNGTTGGAIVPRKVLHEIRKLLDGVEKPVELAIEGAQLIVRSGTSLVDDSVDCGTLSNYQQLIPQNLREHLLVQREHYSHL